MAQSSAGLMAHFLSARASAARLIDRCPLEGPISFALHRPFSIIRAHRRRGLQEPGRNGVLSMPNISSLTCRKCLLPALAAATILTAVACRPKEKIAPFNPRALQEPERAAAQGAPTLPRRALPTTLESPFYDETATTEPATTDSTTTAATTRRSSPPATGPALGVNEGVIRMPLREVIQRAVMHNLDVQVAGYDPAIEETRVTEAEARFDPTFFTNFQYGVDRILAPTPDNPTVDTGGETVFRTYTVQTGVRQELESGGRVEARIEPRWTWRSPEFQATTLDGPPPSKFWT